MYIKISDSDHHYHPFEIRIIDMKMYSLLRLHLKKVANEIK